MTTDSSVHDAPIFTMDQLTVAGQATDRVNARGFTMGTFYYTIANIATNVVVRFEGSMASDPDADADWYNLNVNDTDTTQTANGSYAAKYTGKHRFVRLLFVSESGGTAATIDTIIMLGREN